MAHLSSVDRPSGRPSPVARTPLGRPLWRGLAVDREDLPSLRRSVSDWEHLEPYSPEITRENEHTRAVIRALEEDQ